MRLPDDDPARALFHKAMGHILGEMLEEDSTIRDTVRSSPYSDVLVREVHKILGISHDQQWVRSEKISWKDIKEKSPNFVLLAGSRGTAAVRWNGKSGTWKIITASGHGIRPYNNSSINAVMQSVKDDIGMITGSFEAKNEGQRSSWRGAARGGEGTVDVKRKERKAARDITNPDMLDPGAGMEQNLGAIQKKLRPLYTRYIEQAMADVKGVIGMQLKADAHDRASQKIQILKNLKAMRIHIEDNPDSIPDDIAKKLKPALYMTAAYFYPEETGDIRKGYGFISPENLAGPSQVVKDIANGDGKKLATMMNFFKQSLLH